MKQLLKASLLLSLAATLLPPTTSKAQQASGEKPCGIGEIVLDKGEAGRVLINLPGRLHWKYSGRLAQDGAQIMLGEGFVYKFVQEGERMTSTNIGKYLPIQDGETVRLDQGSVSCVIKASLDSAAPVLEVQLNMEFARMPQRQNYRLLVPQ